ncbi:MAG TPA: hypothetical protein VFQ42_22175 [Mycobacterium sp.]|nr:hypothetical protein [Mycobacterium sp.]
MTTKEYIVKHTEDPDCEMWIVEIAPGYVGFSSDKAKAQRFSWHPSEVGDRLAIIPTSYRLVAVPVKA